MRRNTHPGNSPLLFPLIRQVTISQATSAYFQESKLRFPVFSNMKSDHLNHLRIASPCPANWESMKGDDRVRFCELCNLNVYNIAELTRSEAASLVANAEGRICARLYRRIDGTVITRDCPVGWRAIRRRVATVAGAVFTTLISLSSIVVGQDPSGQDKSSDKPRVTISRTTSESGIERGVISGTIRDRNAAVVVRARISIIDQVTRIPINTESNDEGQFRISGLLPTTYEILFESPGFSRHTIQNITLGGRETLKVDVILEESSPNVVVGLMMAPELIETSGKLIINEQFLRRRP
jgi:hypothetical protein